MLSAAAAALGPALGVQRHLATPGAPAGRRAALQRLEDDTSSPTGRCNDTAVYVCQRVQFQIFAIRVYARKHWTVADYRNEPKWR